jgi:hypothetical protein
VVGESWNLQILVDLLVTNVHGCVSRNAKTLELQHLWFIYVGVGNGPPDRACLVHHGTDELLVKQYAISDGQTTPLVEAGVSNLYLWEAFFRTWVMWADQVNRVSRITPRNRAVSTHCIGSPKRWGGLGLWTRIVVSAKSTAVLFETLIGTLQPRTQSSSQLSCL